MTKKTKKQASSTADKFILSIEDESRITRVYPKLLSEKEADIVYRISVFLEENDLNLRFFTTLVEGGEE